MTNERYVKIEDCRNCKFYGHAVNSTSKTHFCINLESIDVKTPKHTIRMDNKTCNYPIIPVVTPIIVDTVPIPNWCALPDPKTLIEKRLTVEDK